MKKNIIKRIIIGLLVFCMFAVSAYSSSPNVTDSNPKATPTMVTYVAYADPMVFWDPAES